jgi:hypothetical protein
MIDDIAIQQTSGCSKSALRNDKIDCPLPIGRGRVCRVLRSRFRQVQTAGSQWYRISTYRQFDDCGDIVSASFLVLLSLEFSPLPQGQRAFLSWRNLQALADWRVENYRNPPVLNSLHFLQKLYQGIVSCANASLSCAVRLPCSEAFHHCGKVDCQIR